MDTEYVHHIVTKALRDLNLGFELLKKETLSVNEKQDEIVFIKTCDNLSESTNRYFDLRTLRHFLLCQK